MPTIPQPSFRSRDSATSDNAASDSAASRPVPRAGDVAQLVFRVVAEAETGESFLTRRAIQVVAQHPNVTERQYLRRILEVFLSVEIDVERRLRALVAWAGYLESRGRLVEASHALGLASAYQPSDPELLLHSARVARKSGHAERARALYRQVRELDGESGHLAGMARVGQALLEENPTSTLGGAIRQCIASGHQEAAAVALEARARLRGKQGDLDGALRDFAVAAARHHDPADLGRIGHEVADVLIAAGDPLAARRALQETERHGHPEQVKRARARLLGLSWDLGDELGVRRWSHAGSPNLVSLGRSRRSPHRSSTRVHRVHRCIQRVATPIT
ncbi:MAG: hypothetical protein WEA09_10035 [Gemmatimonadota bacterium]